MTAPYRWNPESYEIGKGTRTQSMVPAGSDFRAKALHKTSGNRLYRPTVGFNDLRGMPPIVNSPVPIINRSIMRREPKPDSPVPQRRTLNLSRPPPDPNDGIGRARKQFWNSLEDSPRRQPYSDYLESRMPAYTTHNAEYGKQRYGVERRFAGYSDYSEIDNEYMKLIFQSRP